MAKKTLLRWTQLGVFLNNEDEISLAQPFESIPIDEDFEYLEFRARLLHCVLAKENNSDFLKPTPEGAADFTFSLCWVLAQDIFSFQGGNYRDVEKLEQEQVPEEPFVFQNDTRWEGFRDWAVFLGLGWSSKIQRKRVFAADPSEAGLAVMPAVFKKENELGAELFLKELASQLPVLDGGAYRTKAEKRFQGNWRPVKQREVSPSLTRALLRWEVEEVLTIEQRSDADEYLLLGRRFHPLRSMTHLIWNQRN